MEDLAEAGEAAELVVGAGVGAGDGVGGGRWC